MRKGHDSLLTPERPVVSPAWSSGGGGAGLQVPAGLDRPSLPGHLLDTPAFFSLCPRDLRTPNSIFAMSLSFPKHRRKLGWAEGVLTKFGDALMDGARDWGVIFPVGTCWASPS